MPSREYTCGRCGGRFAHARKGRPRKYCHDCADKPTAAELRAKYERDRERIKFRATEWNRANPTRRSQITRKHYQKTRETKLAYGKSWREANPDKIYAYSALHNARRRGMEVRSNPDDLAYLTLIRHDPCSYCGSAAGEVDHVDPVSRGGDNDWTNFTAACRSCNSGKRDNRLLIYLLRKG